MEVLLVNPPQKFRRESIWRTIMGCTPPLGLALLGAVLERAGHAAAVIDANAEMLGEEQFRQRLEGLRAAHGAPAWVGLTSSTNTFHAALRFARVVRAVFPGAKVVFGGVHASILPDEALAEPAVDAVARGEGEETLLALLRGEAPARIPGLSFRDGGASVHTPDREQLADLAELPIPAYHLLPMHLYRPALGSYRRLPAVGTVISRGCPGRCTFCYGHHLGRLTRYRPIASVLEEIHLLQANWGIRELSFYDDTFTARRGYVAELCEALLAARVDLTWSCFSRVDTVSPELLDLMRRAGCHQICFGIESGSEEILKNIRKHISLPKAKDAIAWTRKAGIETRATFMLGNPGETLQTMEQTLRLALELDPDIALFNITTPFPGTEMFAWADERGYLTTKDWSAYDLSRPVMCLPTVSQEQILAFYAAAHRRFYRRAGYLMRRLLRIRTLEDVRSNWRAVRAVLLGG
jgi:radical SAM superfamily enzyme YgiQ (UPF0313 family)